MKYPTLTPALLDALHSETDSAEPIISIAQAYYADGREGRPFLLDDADAPAPERIKRIVRDLLRRCWEQGRDEA